MNAVSPGFLYTNMVSPNIESAGEAGKQIWDAMIAKQGRHASVEEIGDAVTLLSSPKMSLVNGHNLVCDGQVFPASRF